LGNELLEERSTSSPSISKGIRPILIKRTIVPEGSQIYKKLGDTLKLECQVDGLPPPTIVWYKVRIGVPFSFKRFAFPDHFEHLN
jgi:hypothetical protein